jgi:1-acyl-sn-glycerol-3-phosphate acyltransferase
MGINKVDQKSMAYRVVWYFIKAYHHFIYYRKIEVLNQEKVPNDGALVFTANHQNALMDALALLFSIKRTLVFLARADIFKKKVFAEILYFFRILPVFRPRDGQGEVKKNLETFAKTTEVLQKNLGLVIFPEGTHTDKQSLLPLKKGFVKIALQTEEASNFQLGIRLLPMAITYSNYEQCQETLSINFSEPIDLKPFYESYHEHPAKAFNEIRDRLSDALKDTMIHIEDDEYYENNNFLVRSFAADLAEHKHQNQILKGRNIIGKITQLKNNSIEKHNDLQLYTSRFLKYTKKLNARQQQLFHHYNGIVLLLNLFRFILLSPIIIPSALLQLLNFFLPALPTIFIKDRQFHSTFRFVLGFLSQFILFFPLYFIFHWILPQYEMGVFFLLYLFTLLFITWQLNWLRNLYAMIRIFFFKLSNKKSFKSAKIDIINIEQILRSI